MGRLTHAVALALPLVVAACGEPFVVLGDGPGITRIVLGAADSAGTRVDSIATRTRLFEPAGVAFNAQTATFYAGDRGATRQSQGITTRVARIFSVTSQGRSALLLDGGGCTPGPCMIEPTAIVVAPGGGALIIADQVGHRVFRYVPNGQLTVLAGTGVAASAPDGAVAATSPIHQPAGVAVDADGRVYIAEAGAARVRVILGNGQLATVAGTGVAGYSGDGGPATAAQLAAPAGLAAGGGELYVSDVGVHVVRRIDAAGSISTVAGTGGPGFGGDGGSATAAALNRPVALALAPDGRRLFITDHQNNRIRLVELSSGTMHTFAGTGSGTFTGNRRPAGQTSLFRPWGIDASAPGFLFIVDPGHSVVWRAATGG